MRGVFLHVMADALGSVIVIISAVIMWQAPDWPYTVYVDPGKILKHFLINFCVRNWGFRGSQVVL